MKSDISDAKPLASNEEWAAWGQVDPLYGVASLPSRDRTGQNPWTDQSFYELGALDWQLFFPSWEQYGVVRNTCVEIGCGAGRMTRHLANSFGTVHAVDVSPGMLAYARERVPANVVLHLGDGVHLPISDGSADAIFSVHVMQHLATTAAAAGLFQEAHRILRPGGSLMIHLPVIVWPWGSLLGAHETLHNARRFWDATRTQLGRYAHRLGLTRKPPMQMMWYEILWLHRTLERLAFGDVEVRMLFGDSRMASYHSFVLARKR